MYGSSQATIGHALGKLGHPKSVYTTDKVWTSSRSNGPRQIERSRHRWGVSRFDLLQVHNLVNWQDHLETLRAMKSDGRLGAIGITTSHGARHELLEQIITREAIDFVQFTYNAVPPIPKRLDRVTAEASERIWLNIPPARVWVYRRD